MIFVMQRAKLTFGVKKTQKKKKKREKVNKRKIKQKTIQLQVRGHDSQRFVPTTRDESPRLPSPHAPHRVSQERSLEVKQVFWRRRQPENTARHDQEPEKHKE
jgi:hypothetical protein